MASRSTRASNVVRVHSTELSTDREMFGPYAETTAMLVALVAILAAAWVAAAPSQVAGLPLADSTDAASAPAVYAVNRTTGSDADVVWTDPFDAPVATAVTLVQPTEPAGAEPATPPLS